MAGFGRKPGKFYLPRANQEPPSSLQQQSLGEGGLDQEDLALEGFIKLMKYLRVVLLQDMAVLQAGECLFLFFN
jgi:hypothetical protein